MPPHKRQSRQRSLQDAQAASFAQLPEGVLPLIVAHLDAPARKAAALASRALHSAVAPLWGTAAFTMRDSVDAADPKSADALWLMRRLPGLHSLRIESDLHYFGEGLGDGLALLAATLQARPPAFRLRSFSLASVYMDELARHKQAWLGLGGGGARC